MTDVPVVVRPAPVDKPTLRPALLGLAVLAGSVFIVVLTEMMPIGLLPQISRGLQVSESTTGLVVTVYAVMVAVLAIPITLVTGRLPRKPLLVSTLATLCVSSVLVATSQTFTMLVAARTLGGIAHALFFSVALAYVARLVPRELVGRALALVSGGVAIGTILGVPLATQFGNAYGWRVPFAGAAAVAGVLALFAVVCLPPKGADHADHITSPHPWHRSGLIGVAVANCIYFVGYFAMYTYVAPILIRSGASEDLVPLVLLASGVVGLLGLWFAGTLVDRLPRVGILVALGGVLLGLVGLSFSSTVLPTVVCVLLIAASQGAMPTFFQSAIIRTAAVSPDIAGASLNSAANVGISLGAFAGSVTLSQLGTSGLGPVGAVATVISGVVVVLSRRGFPARP